MVGRVVVRIVDRIVDFIQPFVPRFVPPYVPQFDTMHKPTLYLIPTTLGDSPLKSVLPDGVIHIIHSLDEFIVEDVRTARRFLAFIKHPRPIVELKFSVLSEHTLKSQVPSFLNSIMQGKSIGLLSEAGCPCIADPGSVVVELAHRRGIEVVPLVGPSSILLALMASGLNGQNFAFVGYLPKERSPRIRAIHELEHLVRTKHQTQLFIETPYRNNHMVEDLLAQCQPETRLCIAADLTLPTQFIQTKTIAEWKGKVPDLGRRPVVFLIG